jgi:hypothetical protein
MPGWDWGGASNPNDREENNTSNSTSNNTSNNNSNDNNEDIDMGYDANSFGDTTINYDVSTIGNDNPIDLSNIPGSTEYITEEKTDYVMLPEKKLKMSKGVRPEKLVTLEEKKFYDRVDAQVDKVTGDLGYQLENRLAQFLKSKIPLGFLLPKQYPKRTIAGDRIGDQDIPMDRPDKDSDFTKIETKDDGIDFILKQIAMGNNNWADDPSWWSNLPESQANKYFQGMDQDNSVDKDYLSTHNAAVARINGLLKDNNKYEMSKNNGIFNDWLTGKGLI